MRSTRKPAYTRTQPASSRADMQARVVIWGGIAAMCELGSIGCIPVGSACRGRPLTRSITVEWPPTRSASSCLTSRPWWVCSW